MLILLVEWVLLVLVLWRVPGLTRHDPMRWAAMMTPGSDYFLTRRRVVVLLAGVAVMALTMVWLGFRP